MEPVAPVAYTTSSKVMGLMMRLSASVVRSALRSCCR
jgi:hypothetical protein